MANLPRSEFISVKEYAAVRGLCVQTVRRWIAKGVLKAEQPAGRKGVWFIRRDGK